jgi:hypothetical protein
MKKRTKKIVKKKTKMKKKKKMKTKKKMKSKIPQEWLTKLTKSQEWRSATSGGLTRSKIPQEWLAKSEEQPRQRQKAPRDYTKAIAPKDYAHAHAAIENIVMTQHSAKKGLKLYGEAGAEAVVSEMQQLHDRDVIEPKSANMLTVEEKRKALRYLMYLKKKICRRIKDRGCADGRKQRIYKTKEETSAPTVAIESLFLSSVIDAKEGRAVVTLDIPGAFMQADMDEVLYMKLEGPLVHLLTKVDPKRYSKFIATEHGKHVIYVKLKKALHGTLQAALLFWKDLAGCLTEMGLELNTYI